MLTDLALLLALILMNGVFAMSEIALVSSRRARLTQLAAAGRRGAAKALELSAEPTRFLSTVQVGITSIGILSGAIGESAIADRVRVVFEAIPLVAPYAETLALIVMVAVLTYVSLILGELVPKRLGLTQPERIAALVAGPMNTLARIGRPIVILLSRSTDAVLRLLRASNVTQPAISLEEIKVLMEQGTQEGVFDRNEQDLVANVLHLDDRQVGADQDPAIVARADGSLLVDGALEVARLERRLGVRLVDEDTNHNYHTVGGFAMFALGRVPRVSDVFTRGGCSFEVVDMDGNRVDRLLVTPSATGARA